MATNAANDNGLKHIWDRIIALLSNKVDKETGKGLSTNDYTTAEKSKLAGIEDGAQVNTVNSDDISGSKTVTGNPLTITDGSETYAEELSVDLEPIQDLHGYDKPWVGGAGKNKYPILIGADTWSNNAGATHSNSNGSLVINNVSTSAASGVYGVNNTANSLVRNKSYTTYASMDIVSTANCNISICQQSTISVTTTKKRFKVAIPANFDASFSIFCRSVECTVTISNFMISTEDTSVFEPYENISPITGYTEVVVNRCGKNLFDATKRKGAYDSGFTSSYDTNTYELTVGGIWYGTWVFKCEKNTAYTISRLLTSYTVNRNIAVYPGNENGVLPGSSVISTIGPLDSFSFNSGDNDYLAILIYAGQANYGVTIQKIMLEKGSQASTFEPYHSNTAKTPLRQTVYDATVDVANGVMVVDNGYKTFNGSENWQLAWEGTRVYYETNSLITNGKVEYSAAGVQGISDKYVWLPFDTNNSIWTQRTSNIEPYGAFSIRNNGYVYIKDINCVDANALKTYLASNPLQVCYELATPITYHLTPAHLKLLKGYNYISSNGTTIHLTYQPDNAVGDAVSEAEKYTDRAIESKQDRDVGNYSRNFVEDVLTGTNIGSDGRMSSNSNFNLAIAKVKSGVTYTITTDDGSGFVGGFFTNKPTPQATSYNNSRIVTANKTFTAPIDGYLAFRTSISYTTPQCERGSSPHAYEPYIPTNAELYEMIKALQS